MQVQVLQNNICTDIIANKEDGWVRPEWKSNRKTGKIVDNYVVFISFNHDSVTR